MSTMVKQLTAAITNVLAQAGRTAVAYDQIDKAPEKKRGITISQPR